MAARRATFRGLPRRHKRVWKSRMAGLWRVAVTVTMQGIVRTEACPSQTRRWPGSDRCPGSGGPRRPRPRLAPVETTRFRQFGHDRTHTGYAAQQFGLGLPGRVVLHPVVEFPVQGLGSAM